MSRHNRKLLKFEWFKYFNILNQKYKCEVFGIWMLRCPSFPYTKNHLLSHSCCTQYFVILIDIIQKCCEIIIWVSSHRARCDWVIGSKLSQILRQLVRMHLPALIMDKLATPGRIVVSGKIRTYSSSGSFQEMIGPLRKESHYLISVYSMLLGFKLNISYILLTLCSIIKLVP